MKKLYYLIVLVLILGLALAGCTFLSNIGQAPTTEQSGVIYLTKGVPGPDPTLVGLWHFDDNADDSSGYDNHGAVNGTTYVDGKFGKAMSFDSSDNYVDCGDASSLDINNIFTISAWIKTSNTGNWKWIYGFGQHASTRDRSLVIDSNNKARMYVYGTNAVSTTTVTDGNWHYLVGTLDGINAKIYVDGVLEDTTQPTLAAYAYMGATIGIRELPADFFTWYEFNGTIDQVCIWNRALTDTDITYNYDNSFRDVEIDIKPGSYPNSINLGSNGVVPVAILGSEYFDAATVDPSTVTLAGSEVKVKGHSGNSGSLEDVNGDGYLDLVVQVYTENLELTTGDVNAVLNAYTYTGLTFLTGSDVIRIVQEK